MDCTNCAGHDGANANAFVDYWLKDCLYGCVSLVEADVSLLPTVSILRVCSNSKPMQVPCVPVAWPRAKLPAKHCGRTHAFPRRTVPYAGRENGSAFPCRSFRFSAGFQPRFAPEHCVAACN